MGRAHTMRLGSAGTLLIVFPVEKAAWGQTSRVPGDWCFPGMWIKIWDGFLTPQSSREDSMECEQAVPGLGDRDTPKGFLGRALGSVQPLQSRFQCRGGISLPSITSWYWVGTGEPEGNWWDWSGLDGCGWCCWLWAGLDLPQGQCSGSWPPLSCSFPWKCAKIPIFDPRPPSDPAGMGRWDSTGRQLDRQTDRQRV